MDRRQLLPYRITEGLPVICATLRWAVPEVSEHAQVKRDLKLDVDGPL